MNARETVTLNASAPPGAAGPLAEQQEATIALSTALNDLQNACARILAGWRASLERQGELEREVFHLRTAADAAAARLEVGPHGHDGTNVQGAIEMLRKALTHGRG